MSVIDHKAQAQSRVYAQYRTKSKLMQWIAINGDLGNDLETVYQSILTSYDIDSAGTDELDVLGRIVGIGRSFEGSINMPVFQFGSAQFGNAQFRPSSVTIDKTLQNSVYRLLIKAKISKNSNDATLDGIIAALSFIVTTNDIRVVDQENMSFLVTFDMLTDIENLVLSTFNIVPKPQGVEFSGFVNLSATSQFGRSQFGRDQFVYKFGA